MNTDAQQKTGEKLCILTRRGEEILRTIHFYRYMTARDVAYRLFSPASLVYVRRLLSDLAGGKDEQVSQYLFRFQLPRISPGNTEKIYTLGSRGRDFLAHEAGLPVDWYFRPEKVKHLALLVFRGDDRRVRPGGDRGGSGRAPPRASQRAGEPRAAARAGTDDLSTPRHQPRRPLG